MKRRQTVIVILVICFLYLLGATANTLEVPGDTIVYVTDSGTKYHRDGCSYLESKHAIEKRTAEKQGYEPCSRCDPDTETGIYTSDWENKNDNGKREARSEKKKEGESKQVSKKINVIDIIWLVIGGLVYAPFLYSAWAILKKCVINPVIEIIKKMGRE